MRVIGGTLKGRRILPPKGIKARPTTDFAKEGLFNILQHSTVLEGIRVLDLFAGAGGISLEFISRGATEVVSVELDNALHGHLKKCAEQFSATNWRIVKADVFRHIPTDRSRYDLIFADPPFAMENAGTIPELLRAQGLLAPGGLLIVEHAKNTDLSADPWFDVCRNYGNIHFSFLSPKSEKP
ncbi:MAG: RsmD family RNA methyltransferase [Flavobacteriales bacterium]|nr:RsmD family RNA methyltransferase [Flavobacteriales bacterium]